LDLGKSQNKAHQEVSIWQAKCKDFDPTTLEKHRAMVSTTIVNLKKREDDFEFLSFLVDNQDEKIQEGKKEHDFTMTQLESLSAKVELLDNQGTINKIWIQGLLRHIHLMSNGEGVSSTPLPIEDPPTMLVGSSRVIFVEPCPICSFYFMCNNILMLSCGAHISPLLLGDTFGD
jgi:hypothetical protein